MCDGASGPGEPEVDYNIRPYYIAPDGNVGEDAFVVIRNVIEQMKMVAIGRVVLATREHVIALVPRGKGLMGTLLRYPYEVRDAGDIFDDIPDVKLTKDMMDLARHIVETKSGHFKPEQFEDHYEHALKELIEKKAKGEKIEVPQERADRQGHQSHGCTAPLRAGAEAEHPAGAGQEEPQGRSRAKGNAAADFRKKGRARRKRESEPHRRPAPQGQRVDETLIGLVQSLPYDSDRRAAAYEELVRRYEFVVKAACAGTATVRNARRT